MSDDIIEVCVSAQAREGEANKAVREVFRTVGLQYYFLYAEFGRDKGYELTICLGFKMSKV